MKQKIETLTPAKLAMVDRINKAESEPYDAQSTGPFKTVLDKMEGVFRKEIINYKMIDGKLHKEVSVRDFRNGDYNDTTTVTVLSPTK
jgi:SNF2 family DNA or RNA helicase